MTLRISGWEKWQSYRKDRGQPPWIKVHRCVMRNPEWVQLTDAQRGQLVSLWLLAADKDGAIPASPRLLRKICFMESEPDLQTFIRLGFIEPDANVTSERRQDDRPETETETETETEASSIEDERERSDILSEGGDDTAPTYGDIMAAIRVHLHLNPPWDDAELKRSGHILKTDWRGVDGHDLLTAIVNARRMVDDGLVRWLEPGQPFGLRALRSPLQQGGRQFFDAALDYHEQPEGKRKPGLRAINVQIGGT